MTTSLLVFDVEVFDVDPFEWQPAGAVILPYPATNEQLEHALAAIGLYCPRGADDVSWCTEAPACLISTGNEPMVRMIGREKQAKYERKTT